MSVMKSVLLGRQYIDMMKFVKCFGLLLSFFALLIFGLPLAHSDDHSSSIKSNVPYSSVLKLNTRDADSTVFYNNTSSESELQFIKYWKSNQAPVEGSKERFNESSKESSEDNSKANSGKSPNRKTKNIDLVLVHGGCWLNAFDYKHTKALTTALSDEGFNVWSIEYRRTGDLNGGWPNTFYDITSALAKITENTKKDIVVLGHSAGGHLALLAGSNTNLKKAQVNQQKYLGRVKGIIGLAAITDVVSYGNGTNSCQTATPKFMGGKPVEIPELYNQATLNNKHLKVPFKLLHGDMDKIVPLKHLDFKNIKSSSDNLNVHAKLKNYQSIVRGAGHFDWVHSETVAYQRLLEVLGGLN